MGIPLYIVINLSIIFLKGNASYTFFIHALTKITS